MAEKKYTFPEGTTRISPKELKEAFCNYEIVEIPGSVSEIATRMLRDDPGIPILKNLILHEGTSRLSIFVAFPHGFNVVPGK